MKIGIISTGSWATALGNVLCDNGHDVLMWGIEQKQVDDINNNHRNTQYYDAPLNETLKATTDMSFINDMDILLIAVPTKAMNEVLNKVNNVLNKEIYVINVAKGFYQDDMSRLSLAIKNILKNKAKAVISLIGPSHAEEVVIRKSTIINSVSEDEEAAILIQNIFANDYFRVYRNDDVIGAEISAAVKNVMAIASGMLAGLGEGDNARAALITRGLAEMGRFVLAFGGKKETLLGLNGVGDLVVTCSSKLSRNFEAGEQIGKADSAKEFLENNKKTVESIFTTKIVCELAKEKNISMPITEQVYSILYENKKPSIAIKELFQRELKSENN